MQTRTLGRSGITVGEVGLGTWGLSGEAYGPSAPLTAKAVLRAASDAGCTLFETADCYAEGQVEAWLGELIRTVGRDRVVVSTRVGTDRTASVPARRFDPEYLRAACERSLARLGTDHVDALVLHNPQVSTLLRGETWAAMQTLQREGKARTVGVSVSSVEQGRAALDLGAPLLVLPYNLLFPAVLHGLSGEISAQGAAVVVRSPLAYGLLADTWGPNRRFDEEDHRVFRWSTADLGRRVAQRESLRPLVRAEVRSLRELALRYVLANGLVSAVVPGARTPEQARENARSAKGPPYIPDEDLARVGDLLTNAGIG